MPVNYSIINGFKYLSGTTAQRPSNPVAGSTYYNTTVGALQIYQNGGWYSFQSIAAPGAPTSVVATNTGTGRAYNNGAASVAFNPLTETGGVASSFTVTSTPGSYTATGTSSPITVTGLQSSTQYTYTVRATNSAGTSSASSASSGVTATTVPQAPTIGTATAGNAQASVTFTANATGGSAITSYTVTSSPGNITASGASSPITVTGLTNGTAYTFTVTATNANGTSAASSASNSITPTASYTGETVTGGSGYTNMSTYWSVITSGNTSLTTGGTPQWSCSNQGTYYGGNQTYSAGGTASFKYVLNGGNNLPAGTYSYSGLQYLFWDAGGVSHDGMYLWAVTPTQKLTIVNSVSPPDALNSQITKTGTFTLSAPTTVYLNWEIYDGSSATSMGGRVYNFTVTKTA